MSLTSKLFRGDPAFEACLVRDSAHIKLGALGRHVSKIHHALSVLDGALITPDETAIGRYGPSTASAVLEYKQARSIINRAYQRQADNVVGKMTIAALDREMTASEQKPKTWGCGDPGGAGGIPTPAFAVGSAFGERMVAGGTIGDTLPQFRATLAVVIQLVRVNGRLGPHSFPLANETSIRARALLTPHGLRLGRVPVPTVDFGCKVRYGETGEFEGLRKAAEKAWRAPARSLRVLICPFRANEAGDDDTRNNAISLEVDNFPRFIVMNANTLRGDRGTLLHEMIHCSSAALMSDHAHDPMGSDSIFSWNASRTRLRPEHAQALSRAFFAF